MILDNRDNKRSMMWSRMAISATSLMPIAMGVAASVPVLLLGLSLELGASGLIVWVLGAFIGGWLFGSLLHYLTRPAFDRILDHYVQSLDMVVLGVCDSGWM